MVTSNFDRARRTRRGDVIGKYMNLEGGGFGGGEGGAGAGARALELSKVEFL